MLSCGAEGQTAEVRQPVGDGGVGCQAVGHT